ncbi:hypothetical protein ABZ656_11580 [Streptomyces sp. NPDC007095]|uniref:DinB/UmuC family translesion DNA polymerase n=1 Tax=Streptomyces sp. NPDC007095 TaxID=3154482 RepID=UPI0033DD2B45
MSAEHHFGRDELDPAQHRRAQLALADDLGARLRDSGQSATALACTATPTPAAPAAAVPCPRPPSTPCSLPAPRTRSMSPPVSSAPRVRSIALRAEALRPADRAPGSSPSTRRTTSPSRSKPSPTAPATATTFSTPPPSPSTPLPRPPAAGTGVASPRRLAAT